MPHISPHIAQLHILHLEDSLPDHALLVREFQKSATPVQIERVERLDQFADALVRTDFDVVLADYRLAGFTALDAWQVMRDRKIRLPFVLLSGAIGESLAVQAIQAGISDYLPKQDLHKVRSVTQRAIESHRILIAKERADTELAQSEQQLARFAEHLQTTIEQERGAIAREIHDDVGGALAAIRFDLAWLARHTGDTQTLQHIGAATEMLQQAIEAAQRIMMNLRPAILDQGLVAAIQWLQANFSRRCGVRATLDAQLVMEALPKNVELTVFRTAQEALTNISKHAKCSAVDIRLSSDSNYLTLEISDNGQGMTHATPSQQGGFGLKGLQERAKTVGGWIDISSIPNAGTAITLTIPLAQEAQSAP
ncbi:MAG: histidine kinase [Rhodoferax sp.]|nr:histidine kinase [Rhodoferax sp.]